MLYGIKILKFDTLDCIAINNLLSDVPKLRQSDINFALTAVLNTLWPPTTKTIPITSQNLKQATDMRAGSLTFVARDSKTSTKTSLTLYPVAFLGKRSNDNLNKFQHV